MAIIPFDRQENCGSERGLETTGRIWQSSVSLGASGVSFHGHPTSLVASFLVAPPCPMLPP